VAEGAHTHTHTEELRANLERAWQKVLNENESIKDKLRQVHPAPQPYPTPYYLERARQKVLNENESIKDKLRQVCLVAKYS